MDENYLVQARKDKIRLAGKVFAMKAESVAQAVSHSADRHLRRSVGSLHGAHNPASLFRSLPHYRPSPAQFDFQTRVGLELFDDFVIPVHEICDGSLPAVGGEFAKLVEI